MPSPGAFSFRGRVLAGPAGGLPSEGPLLLSQPPAPRLPSPSLPCPCGLRLWPLPSPVLGCGSPALEPSPGARSLAPRLLSPPLRKAARSPPRGEQRGLLRWSGSFCSAVGAAMGKKGVTELRPPWTDQTPAQRGMQAPQAGRGLQEPGPDTGRRRKAEPRAGPSAHQRFRFL